MVFNQSPASLTGRNLPCGANSTRTVEEPEHKEKFRSIFNQRLTRKQGEIELNQWIEQAKKLKNRYLNDFLSMLSAWKYYVLNYFAHRFTTSAIEGINNTIKTVKRMGYGFRNFVNFKQRIMISFA
ncbi:MAG: transposase [Candidatus Contendobacter sp.]|nr:MAG: transposase [Candidatus Contendobacter sp.]